ncbi:MAG: ribosome maturation factor RimP, partial [Actinomycetota bacterium]
TYISNSTVRDVGFVLEEVKVTPAGKRRIVAVVIDGLERNPSLDEVIVVSRRVSEILYSYSQLGEMPFTLEVTTPGVDRPLSAPRHWRKNIGRLVKVTPIEGEPYASRIVSAGETSATLEDREVDYSSVKRAQIEIEFNRKEKR